VTRVSMGAFAAESRPRQTRIHRSQRIGSVRDKLCTRAASGGFLALEASVTGAAANPNV
jgi:hypothetical protein